MSAGKNSTVLLRTARHCRYEQADEVSSLSCNKKCSETRKSRSIYGAAIQIRTGVHVPRSRLRGSPERPRIEMRFAQGMRSPVYLAIKKCSETRKSRSIYGAAIQIRTGVHVPRSRLRGSPERPRIEMRFAQGMRSPVYLAIKRNAPKLESLGAFMELLSRFELESMSRGAGSAGARNDLGLKCASRKGMRSPVLPTVKEKPSKPEGFEGFWSCYPDSNWRPHPYQGCALPAEL